MKLFAEIIPILAQVAADNPALYTYGPMGILLAWFMWRDERRSSSEEKRATLQFEQNADVMHRIDGLSRALLVDAVETEKWGAAAREYARKQIAKIDAREKKI